MNGTPSQKVHGLTNNWAEPDWPFLTVPELNGILRSFPEARGARAILSYSPRPFSAASVVETPHGRVFVKRHHGKVRDREGLREEHRLLQFLQQRGAKVVRVLADDAGETAIAAAPWTYEVHSLPEGIDLYEKELSWTPFRSAEQARGAGRALAELHSAMAGFGAPARRTQPLVSSFTIFAAQNARTALKEYLAQRPELATYLEASDWRTRAEEIVMPLHVRLRPLLDDLPPMWTHNDFHASNLFWSSAGPNATVQGIVDFGLADRTTAIHDIATAIERNGIRWLELSGSFEEVVHLEHILALLEGYEDLRTLSVAEAEAMVRLLPLVHAEFALSEADYFLRVLQSPERAELAADGYFLGHAAWFGSENGRKLLDALENWAGRRVRRQHVAD